MYTVYEASDGQDIVYSVLLLLVVLGDRQCYVEKTAIFGQKKYDILIEPLFRITHLHPNMETHTEEFFSLNACRKGLVYATWDW